MLSPNATNLATLSLAETVIVTVNVQTSPRALASVTVHATVLVPGLKLDPVGGVHVGPTSGASPPVTVGSGYTIEIGVPVGEVLVTALGQVSFGAAGSDVGVTGLLSPQACSSNAPATERARAVSDRVVRGKSQITH